MTPIRIFISSVQREFAREREQLRVYLRGDPLMRRFFEVFLFEDVPASDRRPDDVYLGEVERCDIYVGLFGRDYGSEDGQCISPTEREFDRATELERHRLIFVRSAGEGDRHPKMQVLVDRAQTGLVRRRFATQAELVAGLYAALLRYLEAKELLRFGPFDAAQCSGATLDDLDTKGMYRFIRIARRARQFPLPEETEPPDLLRHLNLLNRGRLTNAAILLFGRAPQRFLISSEIKCAHFHGTRVTKPIPSFQVYKGTVFALVDQAVDFVLSRIALSVGTRSESVQAPVAYEIPREVVTEAIVNAVAHRDYTDSSSVQVMLFSDRLEVMNSGGLPPTLTVEKLRVAHQSVPGNPLLAESMYLMRYIEKMGTGTVDMIRRCAEAGLPEPEFEVGSGFVTRIWRTDRSTRERPDRTAQEHGSSRKHPENIQKTSRKHPEENDTSQSLADRIVAFLRANPSASRRELVEGLQGATEGSVKYQLDKLKCLGKLRRVGPDRGGRWVVVDGSDAAGDGKSEACAEDEREAGGAPPEDDRKSTRNDDQQPENYQKTTRKPPDQTVQEPENYQKWGATARKQPEPLPLPDRIIAFLRQDPSASRREIAAALDTTKSTVRYQLDKLRQAGQIERVGPDKGGHWKVLDGTATECDPSPDPYPGDAQ